VKCPKCGTAFSIPAEPPPGRPRQAARAAKAVTATPPKSAPPPDAEGMAVYSFKAEQGSSEKFEQEKKRAVMGIVLDRAPKSKRGPAMAALVRPSNAMLGAGLINCLTDLACLCILIWPIIFNDNTIQPKHVLEDTEKKPIDKTWAELDAQEKVAMTQAQNQDRAVRGILIGVCIVSFIYAGLIGMGAVRIQNLESYGWAITSSLMAIFPWAAILWVPCLFWPYWVSDINSWWMWWFLYFPLSAALLTIPAGLWAFVTL